jgi:histidine triad (HIT) family protein
VTITPLGSSRARSASSSACAAPPSGRRGFSLPDTAGCIFCRIVAGDAPATVVNRTDGFVAIEDINPKADVHLLVLPERHLETFRDVAVLEEQEAKRMLEFVADTARQVGLTDYRLMIFVGPSAGQTVFHLHWHILGGRFGGLPE